jgi:hypothetical protein
VLSHSETDDRYFGADPAVSLVFEQWPRNDQLHAIWVKVVVLNRLYSTNIYDELTVARHIFKLGPDSALRLGDVSVVETIANVKFNGKCRRCLSFSSKFCAWHNPEGFQIFDSYVEWILWEYQKKHGFGTFRRYQLREYPRFLKAVDEFKSHFDLGRFSRKSIDKFLWVEARKAWAREALWQ